MYLTEPNTFLGGTIATAEDVFDKCPHTQKLILNGLRRVACEFLGSVIIERYRGEELLPPYATEFDQREVVVAYGVISMTGLAKIFTPDGAVSPFKSFELLQPPKTDQILKISRLPSGKFRNWTISADIVQYKTQGDVSGFDLICAFAKRTANKKSIAVWECFPSERRQKFYSVLNSLE